MLVVVVGRISALVLKGLHPFLTSVLLFLWPRCYMNFPPIHSGALTFSGVPAILLSYQPPRLMDVSVFTLSWEEAQIL